MVRTLKHMAAGKLQTWISRTFNKSGYIGIAVGMIVTFIVQSSSITTSVLVPLAGAGLVTLEQLFPIAVGANIGTTLTAIVASSAGENPVPALTVAFVHLLFNVAGTILIYPLEMTRRLPLRAAEWLASAAAKSRRIALLYVFLLFYGVPALFLLIFH
jgi:sodium-dependent phosphate cotransporter